jgi:chemotaxis protein MotB
MTVLLRAVFAAAFLVFTLHGQAQSAVCDTAAEAWETVEQAEDPAKTADFVDDYSECSAFRNLGLVTLRYQSRLILEDLRTLQARHASIELELRTSQTAASMAEMELDDAKQGARDLSAQNEARLNTITRAQTNISALQSALVVQTTQNSSLNTSLNASAALESDLHVKITALETQAESLTELELQTRTELNDKLAEIDALDETIDTLNGDIALKITHISELDGRVEDLETNLNRRIPQFAKLEADIAEAYRLEALIRRTADASEVQVTQLEAELEQTTQERDHATGALEYESARVEELTSENARQEGVIGQQIESIASLGTELVAKTTENQRLEGIVVSSGTKIDGLDSDISQLSADITHAHARIVILSSRNDVLTNIIGYQENHISGLDGKIAQAQAEIGTLSSTNGELVDKISDLDRENLGLNGELIQARANITETQTQIDNLISCATNLTGLGVGSVGSSLVEDEKAGLDPTCLMLDAWVKANIKANEDKLSGVQVELASLTETNTGLVSEIGELTGAIHGLDGKVDALFEYRSEFNALINDIAQNTPGIEVENERARFTTQILFQPGSAHLSQDGKARLLDVADAMRSISQNIPSNIGWVFTVDGHTDDDPIRGHRRYRDNWDLSHGRAQAVADFLVDTGEIAPSWLAATAFGEFQPVGSNRTEEGQSLNRRIEFSLIAYGRSAN